MRRAFLIALLAAAAPITVFAAPPPKKPASGGKSKTDYSDWNCKWSVSCQEESFVVDVTVSNPKGGGTHTFTASFLPGSGECSIGTGSKKRDVFLQGSMNNGSLSGTIYLCTTSQELVDKNQLGAIFIRHFDASYDEGWVPGAGASIVDAIYKGEHYKRYDADTKDSAPSEPSATPGTYERDEPGDQQSGFEMHRFRPGVDKVTSHDTNPQTTSPPSGASRVKGKADEIIHDGVHEWMNSFREWLGGPRI
jgi:hypothetical protein